jgi:CubicO group peptidase (beta-lactamase class C family)
MPNNIVGHFKGSPFEKIEEIFYQILTERPRSGQALSIWHNGGCVLDIYGGFSNYERRLTWTKDTPSVIFSATKGILSVIAAQLVQSGVLKYEDLVTKWWPEFNLQGRDRLTVRDLLSHRGGLPVLKDGVTLEQTLDWNNMVQRLESEDVLWRSGSYYMYHAITYGWLIGELIVRVSGMSPGEFLQSQIAVPLKLDSWIGVSEDIQYQVAQMYTADGLKNAFANIEAEGSYFGDLRLQALSLGGAFTPELVGPQSGFNDPRVQQAEVPGANGISTARSLAKFWSAVVVETDGMRLLSDEVITRATTLQSTGNPFNELPPPYSRFGMGFQLDSEARRYLSSRSFGHNGAGGQTAFADLEHKIGFAYLTTEMEDSACDTRATRLITALRDALAQG